jgi:electron transfer flavoprotein beta subunit
MNIVVCVSQTPDTTTRVKIGDDGKSLDPTGVKFILNPYDEFAVEEGLQLKEKHGGEVTLLCAGGDSAKENIRLGLAMGADKAILVKNDEKNDSFSVASQLATVVKELGPDVVLFGRQSIDYDSAMIGPTVAELLKWPSVTFVTSLDIDGETVTAERDIEGGKESVTASLPAVITAQKGLNEPRYPKLPDIMKAKKKPIEEREVDPGEARVETVTMKLPEEKGEGKIMEYSPENVKELVRLLQEEAKVI